jgi:hypothetical protein
VVTIFRSKHIPRGNIDISYSKIDIPQCDVVILCPKIAEDFSKPTSPTLHITLFAQDRIGVSSRRLPAIVTGHLPLKDVTFHGEKHTQAGTWSDLGSHLKDAAKQTVGLKP